MDVVASEIEKSQRNKREGQTSSECRVSDSLKKQEKVSQTTGLTQFPNLLAPQMQCFP